MRSLRGNELVLTVSVGWNEAATIERHVDARFGESSDSDLPFNRGWIFLDLEDVAGGIFTNTELHTAKRTSDGSRTLFYGCVSRNAGKVAVRPGGTYFCKGVVDLGLKSTDEERAVGVWSEGGGGACKENREISHTRNRNARRVNTFDAACY
jgi:hypothetical protein